MNINYVSAVRDILVVIATRYGLHSRGNISWREARFSAPVQRSYGPHTLSCTMCNGVIPRVKRAEFGIDKQSLFSSVVKERVDLSSPRNTNCRLQMLTLSKEYGNIFVGNEELSAKAV